MNQRLIVWAGGICFGIVITVIVVLSIASSGSETNASVMTASVPNPDPTKISPLSREKVGKSAGVDYIITRRSEKKIRNPGTEPETTILNPIPELEQQIRELRTELDAALKENELLRNELKCLDPYPAFLSLAGDSDNPDLRRTFEIFRECNISWAGLNGAEINLARSDPTLAKNYENLKIAQAEYLEAFKARRPETQDLWEKQREFGIAVDDRLSELLGKEKVKELTHGRTFSEND